MTEKLVSVQKLMKICESSRLIGEQNASRTGGLREQVGDLVENHGMHRGAYAAAAKAYKMLHKDELKGKEHIDVTIAYLEMVRDNFQGHTGDLDKRAKSEKSEANGKTEGEQQAESNVRALRGIRQKTASPAAETAKDLAGESGEHPVH